MAEHGALLTRLSIWLALCGGGFGAAAGLLGRPQLARAAWTFGLVCFSAHVVCAFGFYHHWSHAEAWRETARQTEALTGFASGAGLWLNYLFGLLWLVDVLWWWLGRRRPARAVSVWHAFFWFMVFNGTVVFGHGAVRWLGAGLCGGVAILLGWQRRYYSS